MVAQDERLVQMIINDSLGTVKIHTKCNGSLARVCHRQVGAGDRPAVLSLSCAACMTKTIRDQQRKEKKGTKSIKHRGVICWSLANP